MKIVIYSPYCSNMSGHYYPYYTSMQRICESLGLATDFYVAASSNIPSALQHKKCFRNSSNRLVKAIYRFFDYKQCINHLTKHDLLFIESYTLSDLIVFSLSSLLKKRKTPLLFFIRDNMDAYPRKKRLFFALISFLKKLFQKKFLLITDSEIISRTCSQSLHVPVYVLPIPHTTFFHSNKTPNVDFKIWFPGNPDITRGKKEIISLCQILSLNSRKKQICISEKFAPLLSDREHVTFLPSFLKQEQYTQLHNESDIIFLLYDPTIYCSRTSGIFVEAVTSKTLVVVLEGSWLAYELKKFDLHELVIQKKEINTLFPEKLFALVESKEVACKFQKMHESYLDPE